VCSWDDLVFKGLAITVLAAITDVGGNDAETWALSAQNFLICLEMLLFSIAHFYCFPTDEWEPDYRANFQKSKFGDSIALGDFLSDIKLIMKGNSKKKKKMQPLKAVIPECEEGNTETENGDAEDDEDDEGDPDLGTEENSSISSDQQGSVVNTNSESREVEEARNRLLHTGLLDDLLFMQVQQPLPTVSEIDSQHETAPLSGAFYGATDGSWSNLPETPSERSSLVLTSGPMTPLRPSIFTTIAALSDKEHEGGETGSPGERQ
jgi:Organic solute transporter Ostalpha